MKVLCVLKDSIPENSDAKPEYEVISGQESYEYMHAGKRENCQIIELANQDCEYGIRIEVEGNNGAEAVRERKRQDYVKSEQEKSGLEFVSMDVPQGRSCDETDSYTLRESIMDEGPSVEEQVEKRLERGWLYKAMYQLPPIEEKILYLSFLAEPRASEREIEEELGIPRTNIQRMKKQALVRMRKILGQNGKILGSK